MRLRSPAVSCIRMSLAEIKSAVAKLSPLELADLVVFIQAQDGFPSEGGIEMDFAPAGKHNTLLAEIDVAVDEGNAARLP